MKSVPPLLFCLLYLDSFVLYLFSFYFYFVQRKKHFIFVGFLFQSNIFLFNVYFCKFDILCIISVDLCLYLCCV